MRRGDRTAVIPARADHRPLIKHITVATQIPKEKWFSDKFCGKKISSC